MIGWLKRIADTITNFFRSIKGIWTKGIDYLHRNLVLKILLWSAALGSLVSYTMQKIDGALSVWNTLPDPESLLGASGSGATFLGELALPFAFVNKMLPLDELMLYLPILLLVRVSLVSYRFVKSWIPTVSG